MQITYLTNMDNKAKFKDDMKIIQESLRMAYGPYTKQEKIGMFLADLIWALFPIITILTMIAAILILIFK